MQILMLSYINIFKRLYIYCAIANTLEVHSCE
nr:MAG TPA: hypothetical protein [Caudoviricetes sp.]